MYARPLALLDELRAASVDSLPEVLLVDLAHDAQLRVRMEEAHALLLPAPPAARPVLLALLVSSWTGGHVYEQDSGAVAGAAGGSGSTVGGMDVHSHAVSESVAWRREHLTNVRPLGSVL